MPSAPVAPSLPLPVRAVLPRSGGGDASPAPGGPSRDFASILQASPAETGGPAHAPEPPTPMLDHDGPQDDAGTAIPEPADAAQDPADGTVGFPIHTPGQAVLPRRADPDSLEAQLQTPLPEAQATGARSMTTPEPGDPDPLMPPAGPGLALVIQAGPADAAQPLIETAPGMARGGDVTLTRPGATNGTAPATAPDPQGHELHPNGTGTTAAATPRPEEGRIPPFLQASALGPRAQSVPMKPEERADRAGPAPRLDAGAGQTQAPGQQAGPAASAFGAAHPRLAEMARVALQTATSDPEVTIQHFDLRGADAVANRPQSPVALLHPDLPRHMAMQLAAAAQSGQPDRPVQVLLNPTELGHVRITLHAGDGTINVTVITERPETLDLMRRHIETLAQEFQKIGYRAAEFSFGDGHSAGSGNTAPDRHTPQGPGGILPDTVSSDAAPGHAAQVISDRLDLRL